MKVIKHDFTNPDNAYKRYRLPERSHPSIQSGWTNETLNELYKTDNVVGLREVLKEKAKELEVNDILRKMLKLQENELT